MRVALVASVFAPSIGGIQSQVRALAAELVRQGVEPTIVTRHHRGLPAYEMLDGVPVHRVGRGDAFRVAATASAISASWAKLSELPRFDVVHAHQMLSPMTIALGARLFGGVPIVVTPHACGSIGDVAQLADAGFATGRLRLALARRNVDAFVAISDAIQGELREVRIPEQRIRRIPNGVDVDRFRPAAREERASLRHRLGLPQGPLVVYAGRLSAEKGIDALARAWPHAQRLVPEASLLVLGEGPLAHQLRGVPGIDLRGPLEDTSEYLRAADTFVLPSRTEGLPVAMLEAMASGLDSVATRVGGTPELVRDGIEGVLVTPEDPASLATALARSLTSDRARERGKAARKRAVAAFSLTAVATRTIALYEELVRTSPRRQPRENEPHAFRHAS